MSRKYITIPSVLHRSLQQAHADIREAVAKLEEATKTRQELCELLQQMYGDCKIDEITGQVFLLEVNQGEVGEHDKSGTDG